jgi:hypothetical protein
MRKSSIVQLRSWKTTCCLVISPFFFCLLVFGLQLALDVFILSRPENEVRLSPPPLRLLLFYIGWCWSFVAGFFTSFFSKLDISHFLGPGGACPVRLRVPGVLFFSGGRGGKGAW